MHVCFNVWLPEEDLWEHRRKADHEPSKDFGKPSNMFQHTPEELQNMGHLKCEICSNYYPHKRSLRRHLYKVHRDILPKWNCPICGAEFETRKLLFNCQLYIILTLICVCCRYSEKTQGRESKHNYVLV